MTLKKALLRGLVGIPIGVFISYTITVVLSLGWGQGYYAAAVPAFVETVGTESGAVGLQYLLACLMGFVFATASAIWEVERWSLTRQTVLHFFALSLGMFPAVWLCRWAEYTPGGILGYFGIFIAIYVVLWFVITTSTRKKVREVNQKLQGR